MGLNCTKIYLRINLQQSHAGAFLYDGEEFYVFWLLLLFFQDLMAIPSRGKCDCIAFWGSANSKARGTSVQADTHQLVQPKEKYIISFSQLCM